MFETREVEHGRMFSREVGAHLAQLTEADEVGASLNTIRMVVTTNATEGTFR
jgi:hypothetical protein